MPIKLKNANVLPRTDVETVAILGLNIPLAGDLPFGAQVEWFDLVQAREEGKVGVAEFMMRALCLFTRRLPKREWVSYDWLAQQRLETDEMTELFEGIARLMEGLKPETVEGDEAGEGNAPRRGKAKT